MKQNKRHSGVKNIVPKLASVVFGKKDGALGVAKKKREYDIPLHRKMGSQFLVLLIGLMTFLAILALTGSFLLSSLTERWTTGLENKLTVEIPAETTKGNILAFDEVLSLSEKTARALDRLETVETARALTRQEIEELLAPWLGRNIDFEDIPLPGLVAVQVRSGYQAEIQKYMDIARNIAPQAQINTHKKWLKDIVNLAETLNLTAIVIALVIAFTTFAAVAGAIHSRIAAHYEELELLHLMGATDSYISRQFQRHALLLALKGSLAGVIAALFLLGGIEFLTGDGQEAVLPELSLTFTNYVAFLCVPIIVALISALTARRVALKELSAMP